MHYRIVVLRIRMLLLPLWVISNRSPNSMQIFVKVVQGSLITTVAAAGMVLFNGHPATATTVLDAMPMESDLTHQQQTPRSHSYSLNYSGNESSLPSKQTECPLDSTWGKHTIGLAGAYMVIVLLTLINMLQNLLALRFPSHK